MRKILLALSLGLAALTGCKKDPTPPLVENPTLPPATETFVSGETVTVKGSGFTAADEIWFRFATKAATDEVKATITKQTATEITFIVPQGLPQGENTIILKRGSTEMPLGKITVAQAPAVAAKFYGLGRSDNADGYEIVWEVDKTTGELTEIVRLPDLPEWWWSLPVADPASGNLYCLKGIYDTNEEVELYDLYRIDPNGKTLNRIGTIKDNTDTEENYLLCMVDGRLHALIARMSEKESDRQENCEVFCSLVSVDPTTAEQTPVADFGSFHQALGVRTSTSVELFTDNMQRVEYDPGTKSFRVSVEITDENESDTYYQYLCRFDVANKKIVPGEKFNDFAMDLFSMGDQICGAWYNRREANSVIDCDFRPIDTEKLTAGSSIGSATLEPVGFDVFWCYDASTGKAFTVGWKNLDEDKLFGAFDFNTKRFEEIKEYPSSTEFYLIFQ